MAAPFADSPFRGTPSLARSASGNSVRKSWADLVEQNDELQQDAAGAEGNLSNECLPSAVGNVNCVHCATPGADSYGIPREDDRDDDNLVTLKISESPFHFSPPRSVLPGSRASPSSHSRNPRSPCGAVAYPGIPSLCAQPSRSTNGAKYSNSSRSTCSHQSPRTPSAHGNSRSRADAETANFVPLCVLCPSPYRQYQASNSPSTSYYSCSTPSSAASPSNFAASPIMSNGQSTPHMSQALPTVSFSSGGHATPYAIPVVVDSAVQMRQQIMAELNPAATDYVPWPGQQLSSHVAQTGAPDADADEPDEGLHLQTERSRLEHGRDSRLKTTKKKLDYMWKGQLTSGTSQSHGGAIEGTEGETKEARRMATAAETYVDSAHEAGGLPAHEEIREGKDFSQQRLDPLEHDAIQPTEEKQSQQSVPAVGTTAANSSAIQQCKIVPIQWPVSESSGRRTWVGRSVEPQLRCFNGSTYQSDHHAIAERWLKDLGSAVVEHKWNFETAFKIIRGRFRGRACMWFKSNWQIFRKNEGGLRAGWEKFWTGFEATFVLKDEKELKDELEKRVQKHEESIEEYAAAIKELVRRLGYQVDDANVRFHLIRGLLDPGTRAKLETVLPATFADILRKVDDYLAYDCYCATMKTLSVSENTDQQLPKKHIAGEIEAVSGGSLVQEKKTVQESSTAFTDTSGTSSSEQNTSRRCASQQALATSKLQEGIMAQKRTTSKNLHGHQNKSVISSAETAVNTKTSRIQSSGLLLKNVAAPQPDNGTTVHGIVKGRNHCLPGNAVGNVVLFDQAAGVEDMHKLPATVKDQALDHNQIRHPSRNRKQRLWAQKLEQSTITGKTK